MLQSYVYESQSNPTFYLSDADIILIDPQGKRQGVIGSTDENGDFSVNWPGVGYAIEISRAGYEPLVIKDPAMEIGLSGIELIKKESGSLSEVIVSAVRKPSKIKKKGYALPIAFAGASAIAFGFAFFYKW